MRGPSSVIVLDTETTGLDPEPGTGWGRSPVGAAVVSIGAVLVTNGIVTDSTFYRQVNPGQKYLDDPNAAGAFKVYGFNPTTDFVDAPEPRSVVVEFDEWARSFFLKDVHLTAFNVEFDGKFLKILPWMMIQPRGYVWDRCIMLEATERMPAEKIPMRRGRRKFASLASAVDHYQVPSGDAHHALDDAIMAAGVMAGLIKEGSDAWWRSA